jgi:uncharacterized phage protein gp47/JayE
MAGAVSDDLLDFLPLFPDETEDAILARMRDWANEGLDPVEDAESWVDTREGSHWHVSVMPSVRELARLYDKAGTEVPASGFPVWAWGDYLDDHAEVQTIARLAATPATVTVTFSGDAGTPIPAGTVVGVEPIAPDDPAPEFEVTVGGVIPGDPAVDPPATVDLVARATEAGVAGNVGARAITVVSTPIPSLTVTNAAAASDGSEPESDEALRERVLGAYVPKGAGTAADYERWARAWAGVGRVTVIPLWAGPGTVKVIVTDAAGEPLSPDAVAAIQADLDPNPGRGDGKAPISANVTVETATARPLDIAATVEFEAGFSLDGGGGAIALRGDIVDALREYVERVQSGGEEVVAQLVGRIVSVAGVHDARIDSFDGVAPPVNVAIGDDPPEAPQLGDVALVEGAL